MKDMKNLDREAERRNIKCDNDTFILIIIGIVFLACLVFSPIGFICGLLLSNRGKDRNRTFVIGVGLTIVGVMISFIYAINLPIGTQINNFFIITPRFLEGKKTLLSLS